MLPYTTFDYNYFKNNSLAFSQETNAGKLVFNQNEYLDWLEGKLANELGVMRTVSERGGTPRKPFQAEFAVMRKYNLIQKFRLGVGLEINWPAVQRALEFDI